MVERRVNVLKMMNMQGVRQYEHRQTETDRYLRQMDRQTDG